MRITMENVRKKTIDQLGAGSLDTISRGDERMETYCEDTMMRGEPDLVVRARDEQDVREVMAFCHANAVPLTFCASQTSMTGSSVARGGVLLSTEKLEGVVDIDTTGERPAVSTRTGTVTAELQKAVADAGWFFPVAPTSRDECRIGANLVTNASGEDSYKYGPIRPYVRRANFIMADGSERTFARRPDDVCSREPVRGGYEMNWNNPLDLMIGSEGTLAFVSEITLEIIPRAHEIYSLLAPFSKTMEALSFITDVVGEKDDSIRALELIDAGALAAMRTAEGFPKLPDGVEALVYLKQEFDDDARMQKTLESWYERIVAASGGELADAILVAETDKQKEDFRLWRHRIPEWANEQGHALWNDGGGKVGSDWWVPVPRLAEMLNYFYSLAKEAGMSHMAYAHMGRGHPHTNLIAKDAREHERAHEILLACCRRAVDLGGGVSGEHGLGKLHTDLLGIQYPRADIDRMKAWKKEYDPKWILGRGTIFNAPPL